MGMGIAYHGFQDTRFTDQQLYNLSFLPELGFTHYTEKNYYHAYLNAYLYRGTHPATETIQYGALGFTIQFGYMRGVIPGLYLGGTWNILDYMTMITGELHNNENMYHTASDLLFSARYEYAINESWKLEAGAGLGIISFVKTAPSFTANFQQNVVDKGNVSFQDEETRKPFNLKYIDVKPFWDQLYVCTNLELFFRRRFSLAYTWRMRTFWDQKNYPVTAAAHSLALRIHFISRPKNK